MTTLSKKEIRRQQIAAAAQAVAARDGAEGTTLRAIAAEAGMAANAVLYYYGSLAEITAAAAKASSDRFLKKLSEAVRADMSPTIRLAAVIRAGSAGLDDNASRILYEFWPHSLRDSEMRRIQEELTNTQQTMYEEIITDGIRAGEFFPVLAPGKIARSLVAQEDGLLMDVLAGTATSDFVLDLLGSLAAALLGIEPRLLLEHVRCRNGSLLGS